MCSNLACHKKGYILRNLLLAIGCTLATSTQVFGLDSSLLPYGLKEPRSKEIPISFRGQLQKAIQATGIIKVFEIETGSLKKAGSGFLAPSGSVYTSCHFLSDWLEDSESYRVSIKLPKWTESVALTRLGSKNELLDLCVINSEGVLKDYPQTLPILKETVPKMGMRIAIIGHPLGSQQALVSFGNVLVEVKGTVNERGESGTLGNKYVVTASSVNGMSGGPVVLLSNDGKLRGALGINIGPAPQPQIFLKQKNPVSPAVYYSKCEELNTWLFFLLCIPEPQRNLKITKGGQGKFQSKTLAAILSKKEYDSLGDQPLSRYVTEVKLDQDLKYFDGPIQAGESYIKAIEEKKLQAGDKRIQKYMEDVNGHLYSRAMKHTVYPVAHNFPFHTQEEIGSLFTAESDSSDILAELKKLVGDLEKTKNQLRQEHLRFREKLKFFSSTEKTAFLLSQQNGTRKGVAKEEFYQRYIFNRPASFFLIHSIGE